MAAGHSTAPDTATRNGVAAVARVRARGWRVIAELLSEPDGNLVERLRNGDLVGELRESVQWLGDDAGRFMDGFMVLDIFGRRAGRRTVEEELHKLHAEYVRLFPDGPPVLIELLREMADLAEVEAEAWSRGDYETGKTMRVQQNARLEAEMVDTVPAWCVELDDRASLMLYKLTPRLLTSYLTVESGRDFDRVVFYRGSLLSFED